MAVDVKVHEENLYRIRDMTADQFRRLAFDLAAQHPAIFFSLTIPDRELDIKNQVLAEFKNSKLHGIRRHRELTGSSLKDAKDYCDILWEKEGFITRG